MAALRGASGHVLAAFSALGAGTAVLLLPKGTHTHRVIGTTYVVALALVAKHPNDVRTLVAHEPPLASLVPDREHALAATKSIYDAYQANGSGVGMARFMLVVMHGGPFTPEVVAQPTPDPTMFGMSAEDDGGRNDLMLAHQMQWLVTFEPDFEALKRSPTRIVMAVGAASNGNLAQRGNDRPD